jgi:L-lactate permease
MNFHGNFLFDLIPFVFGVVGLVFYLGMFALIVLGIIFLYKKIQSESQIDRIENDLQEIKSILKNMREEFNGDLDEK